MTDAQSFQMPLEIMDYTPSNSSIGCMILYGGLTIYTSENVTNKTSGGSITTNGGVSIGKDLLVDGYINTLALTSTDITTGTLFAINSSISHSIFTNISTSTLNASLGITTGTLSATSVMVTNVSTGSVKVSSTEDATGITTGALQIKGGMSIEKDIYSTANIKAVNYLGENIFGGTTGFKVERAGSTSGGLYFASTGNTGINTTNPNSRFHVALSDYYDVAFSTWTPDHITFGSDQGGTAGAIGLSYHSTLGGTLLSVSAGVAWKNMTYRALNHHFLTSNGSIGNVGIGTTNPAFNLDVVGSMRSSTFTVSLSTINNLLSTNISTSTLNASTLFAINSSIPNSIFTNVSTSTLNASTGITTGTLFAINSSIPNSIFTNMSTSTLNASTGITTGSLRATNSSIPNSIFTNISTSTLNASIGITTGTLLIKSTQDADSMTTGALQVKGGISLEKNIFLGQNIFGSSPGFKVERTGSNSGLYFASTGNVGINTYTPNSALNVILGDFYGASFVEWSRNNVTFGGTSGSIGLAYDYIKGGTMYSVSPGVAWKNMTYQALSHHFLTSNGSSGNIGIGTTSPVYNLDVRGTLRADGSLLAEYNSNTIGSCIFTTGGNVGIGTVSPTSLLTVNGQITTGNIIALNAVCTNSTFGQLRLINTQYSLNGSVGSLIANGGITVSNTTNSASFTSGGAITTRGGASVEKDMYVGGVIIGQNVERIIIITHELAVGTNGGTFTNNAWRTRVLNTIKLNMTDSGLVSLASNQVTLSSGTYLVVAKAVARLVQMNQLRWRNITDSTTDIVGLSGRADVCYNGILEGVVNITSNKTFELQHYCSTSRSADGFGIALGQQTEIYAVVRITRINV